MSIKLTRSVVTSAQLRVSQYTIFDASVPGFGLRSEFCVSLVAIA